MQLLIKDLPEAAKECLSCPRCGSAMSVRENTTTFWEKQKERFAYYCSNTNCLHREPLPQSAIDIMRIEQSLMKWEVDMDTIEQEILEKYEIKELLHCLKKTLHYLRKGNGCLSAKDHFLQELTNPAKKKRIPWKIRTLIIPLALLLAMVGTITWLAPHYGVMMQASILSILP